MRSFDARELVHNRAIAADPTDARARTLVSCGRPPDGQRLAIVDPHSRYALGPGQVGEIWVAGANIATEYWGKPEESTATFRAFTADGAGPFLRTGDLGFLDGDELFISGRRKDLIIIRGRNYHPQDLEQSIEACHPVIKPFGGAAFSIDADGGERLIVVQEITRSNKTDLEEVSHAVRRAIFDAHDLAVDAVVLVRAGSIPEDHEWQDPASRLPRALSGWRNRRPARARHDHVGHDSQAICRASQSARNAEIADVWCEVLGLDRVGVFDQLLRSRRHEPVGHAANQSVWRRRWTRIFR